MIKKVVDATNPSLRKKSKPIKKFDKKLKMLVRDLKDTIVAQKDPEGIGLAAPQIRRNVRVFIIKPDKEISVFINPKVIKLGKTKSRSDEKKGKANKTMEGCLSLPHFYGPLLRSDNITIQYSDEKGVKKTARIKGLDAQIIQHEIDHLNGKLFTDHLLKQKERLYELVDGEWEVVDLFI